ncbi:MAG: hypothetical protein ABSB25_03135 [Sedimentisphaerales bacterium]|jgi:hypothetical protein
MQEGEKFTRHPCGVVYPPCFVAGWSMVTPVQIMVYVKKAVRKHDWERND